MEDYSRAEEAYRRGLDIRIKSLGPQHPDTAASYNALGVLSRDLGPAAFVAARSYLTKAIEIIQVAERVTPVGIWTCAPCSSRVPAQLGQH